MSEAVQGCRRDLCRHRGCGRSRHQGYRGARPDEDRGGAGAHRRPDADVSRLPTFRGAALEDKCPHRGGPLSQGIVHDGCVTCPLHNWVISLESGRAQGANEGAVKTIPVKVEQQSAARRLTHAPFRMAVCRPSNGQGARCHHKGMLRLTHLAPTRAPNPIAATAENADHAAAGWFGKDRRRSGPFG
jgi:nitrite reductase (NADH) small subunit